MKQKQGSEQAKSWRLPGTAEFAGISGLAVVQPMVSFAFFIYLSIVILPPISATSFHFHVHYGVPTGNPIELRDGRLVSGDHGFVICGICCVNYSFMENVLADEDEAFEPDIGDKTHPPTLVFNPNLLRYDDIDTLGLRFGSGRVLFTKFTPSNDTIAGITVYSRNYC